MSIQRLKTTVEKKKYKFFSVYQTLLANTKPRKNFPQQVIGSHVTSNGS